MLLVHRKIAVSPGCTEIREIIERHAPDREAARRLVPRVLLHLPRLADETGRLGHRDADIEVAGLAAEEVEPPSWMATPRQPPRSATQLRLEELDEARATVVLERFHYLRSHRPVSLHLAGMAGDRLAALLSFSQLDLGAVNATLPTGVRGSEVSVLARAYAVGWAPRNSLSRLLSLAARRLRERDVGVGLMLTYLNPNLGFNGASYKAANWMLYGRETGTRYAYLDGRYITDRQLTQRFGTSDATELPRVLGERIAFSRMELEPLLVYGYALDPRLRGPHVRWSPREWPRPWA